MADHCYNLISFFGNDKVLKQVHAWRKKIAEFKPTKDDPNCMRAINEVFYPGQDREDVDYGSKWVHLDDASTGAGEDQLGLQSAWNSPDSLLEHMASLLYKLDPHVIIENTFNIEDGSIGFRYITPLNETETYTQEGDYQVSYEDYEEPEEAEEAAYEEYKLDRLEFLTDMISDVPETFDVIKAFITDLVEDWDTFKLEMDERAAELEKLNREWDEKYGSKKQ